MKRLQQFIHKWSWVILLAFCVTGIFWPSIGVAALFCMTAPVIVAVFKGRRWCGVYCPRGSFNDVILSRLSLKRPIPSLFLKTGFKLTFLGILMGAFAIQLFLVWGDLTSVGMVFVRMILITTLLTAILGTFFKPRTWCLICPMGTLAHYVTKTGMVRKRIKHIVFDKNKCFNCKICSRNCPITIDVHSYRETGKVLDANCLKCHTCIDNCPKKSLSVA